MTTEKHNNELSSQQEVKGALVAAAAAGSGMMTAKDLAEAVELITRGEVERAALALFAVGVNLGSAHLETLLVKGGVPPLFARGAATTLKVVAALANIAAGNTGAAEALVGEALDAVAKSNRTKRDDSDDAQ